MSGPKVVRIVTREELEASCRSYVAAFEAAAAELRRCAERHDRWTTELQGAIDAKRRSLRNLFDGQRWSDVQKQAAADTDFLRGEIERMKAGVVSKAEAAHGARRRVADAARSVASALESAGRKSSAKLDQVTARALTASDAELESMQAILNAAFSELKASESSARPSAKQPELADRLGRAEQHLTYADWLAAKAPMRDSNARLDRLLAELVGLENGEAARRFTARGAAIAAESSANQRALLTDSLVLDLSAHLAEARRRDAILSAMREARLMLDGLSEVAGNLARKLERAISDADVIAGEKLVNEAKGLAAADTRRTVSLARRRAVLKGLAALGYEVREKMATAWVQAGRIIVKKAGATDYGVELGATPDAEQLQVRLVGAAKPREPRTAERDRDTESRWCEDFGTLTRMLAETGTQLKLQHALPVGAQPIKTVEMHDVERDARSERRPPLERRRP